MAIKSVKFKPVHMLMANGTTLFFANKDVMDEFITNAELLMSGIGHPFEGEVTLTEGSDYTFEPVTIYNNAEAALEFCFGSD